MNLLKTIYLFIVACVLTASAQDNIVNKGQKPPLPLAPEAKAQAEVLKVRLEKMSKEFDALPVALRKKYVYYKTKAFDAEKDEKYFTSLLAIYDAQAVFDKDIDLVFLNGLCRAHFGDVDKAIELYTKALKINPTHMLTLLNMVEIHYYAGRYQEAIKYIKRVRTLAVSRALGRRFPLLEFKLYICLTKLSATEPAKYKSELSALRAKYTFMDDNPFYYYVNALEQLKAGGERKEGLTWVLKAYLIFKEPVMINSWNKALEDAGYIDAYEMMFKKKELKK